VLIITDFLTSDRIQLNPVPIITDFLTSNHI
jgi:hypothetical protein